MYGRSTQAGGFLLALSITIGFVLGVLTGEPTKGAVLGTAGGVLIALVVWLVDRRRGGN